MNTCCSAAVSRARLGSCQQVCLQICQRVVAVPVDEGAAFVVLVAVGSSLVAAGAGAVATGASLAMEEEGVVETPAGVGEWEGEVKGSPVGILEGGVRCVTGEGSGGVVVVREAGGL